MVTHHDLFLDPTPSSLTMATNKQVSTKIVFGTLPYVRPLTRCTQDLLHDQVR
jgi:hypothetical protein